MASNDYMHRGPPLFVVDNLIDREVRAFLERYNTLNIRYQQARLTYRQLETLLETESNTIIVTRDSYIAMKH